MKTKDKDTPKKKAKARGGNALAQSSVATVTTAPSKAGPRTCVAYSVDGNMGSQARMALALRSLLRHTSDTYDVVVMCDSYLASVRQAIADDLGPRKYIEVYDMDEALASAGMYATEWRGGIWPFNSLSRLGVPLHPLFAEYDRVLTLDVDVLVSSDRVCDLLSSDLAGCEVRGAPDVGFMQGRVADLYARSISPDHAARLRSVLGNDMLVRPYVNSGVILWNLPETMLDISWYKERLSMFWESYRRGGFNYPDQDFINAMMRVRADLAPCFNTISQSDRPVRGVLTHYVGSQYQQLVGDALASGLFITSKEKEA